MPEGDYFVQINHWRPKEWGWEIQRRSKPLGVQLYEEGYRTPVSAQVAGEMVLLRLLDQITQEEHRTSN
jgi:hypothetical protein